MFGLNFELGKPGTLEEHKQLFASAYEPLKESGGLISIMNHPCTLVLERWFSTDMKPRELTEAAYEHFEVFIRHVLSHEGIRTIAGKELLDIYPDCAQGRVFNRDELLELARGVGEEVKFLKFNSMALSAAELFGMFARFLFRAASEAHLPPGEVCPALKRASSPAHPPPGEVCLYLDGPARRAEETKAVFSVTSSEFVKSLVATVEFFANSARVPDEVLVGEKRVRPDDYFVSVAHILAKFLESGRLPEQVKILRADNVVEKYADESVARSGWAGSMMPPEFEAHKLLELARLQTWTLKPAVLCAR